jgi:hypothetical protein
VTPGVLVLVRCKARSCRKPLAEIADAPARGDEDEWACYVRIPLCQRHGDGAGRGNIAAWKERQRRAGKDPGRVQTHRMLPWAEFRPAVERARETGRTQVQRV